MYADDTIIFSENSKAFERLLHAIEREGDKYGMTLNKTKCEAICMGGKDRIAFRDGDRVPPHREVKYLGCMLNDKGDPVREINKRTADCYVTWKRLGEFWKHADCSLRFKLGVYDAVIRSKLVNGLESVQVNDALKKKIDTFQLKGLRQILGLKTT